MLIFLMARHQPARKLLNITANVLIYQALLAIYTNKINQKTIG
jgi:hypothetical protein